MPRNICDLVRVILQPGAQFDRTVVKSEEYCELTRGTLAHTDRITKESFVKTSLGTPNFRAFCGFMDASKSDC